MCRPDRIIESESDWRAKTVAAPVASLPSRNSVAATGRIARPARTCAGNFTASRHCATSSTRSRCLCFQCLLDRFDRQE